MTTRSPVIAILWETWRVTRVEAAWKLAFGIVGGLVALALGATVGPADEYAALAMTLLVLPHGAPWLSLARLSGDRPGFPLYLHYTRPVRTMVIVGAPMVYLTAMSWAIYLVSALLLRATSGYAFPLLPIGAWMAALTVVYAAGGWSTRNLGISVLVWAVATLYAWTTAVERLTAVELPGGYDWPPRLWPTLFDFPRTDYAWIALIVLASFFVTLVMVTRQRRGDELSAAPRALAGVVSWTAGDGWWVWLVGLFRVPCPTASATRAQVWLELKSSGLPVLTIGVALASVILLVSAVSGPVDAAWNADPGVSCPIEECFWVRAMPPLFTPLSLFVMLCLGGNAFGIRRRQGRTYVSAFEAIQAHGAAQLAALKLLVKSFCVLAALIAIVVSAWISMPLLGDAVFIQMIGVPLNSQRSVFNDAVAALTGYEQLSLVVVAVIGVVIWVAAFAVLGALWTRYSRRMNIAGSLLLLYGLALALLALAGQSGIGPEIPLDAILRATSWVAAAAIVLATVYIFWSVLAERLLTVRQASVVVFLWTAVAAASLTVLRAAGLSLADMPTADAVRMLSPALLPLTISVLAPWSYSRMRSW
ncbi:MAG: hypothetical protein ACRD3G_09370 [Vicinamibacterales bacterium]